MNSTVDIKTPRIVVLSSLYPNANAPNAGVFIRERMSRVAKRLPVVVVSPKPWFPGQELIRCFRPHYRPSAKRREIQDGVEVLYPRFLSFPGIFRRFDGLSMALGCYLVFRKLRQDFGFNLIDTHFAWPDGCAAAYLGKWFNVPFTVTLRGSEPRDAQQESKRQRMRAALQRARMVFSVSDSLRQFALSLGIPEKNTRVVGNGVDIAKFQPVDKLEARSKLHIPESAHVLVSVGGLVERKGFHRVIACLPGLVSEFAGLRYLIVGGPSPEGDNSAELKRQVAALGLEANVMFLGPVPSAELKWPLSSADVFVLATRNEGWANVFLEAMAVGLPVVTTDVGGNREVVCRSELGSIVPFGEEEALTEALKEALRRTWQKDAIRTYAENNGWDARIDVLQQEFERIVSGGA